MVVITKLVKKQKICVRCGGTPWTDYKDNTVTCLNCGREIK